MVERKSEEDQDKEKENAPLILKNQDFADLRQIARKNLEEAERVLAESGHQLQKNMKENTEPEDPGRN